MSAPPSARLVPGTIVLLSFLPMRELDRLDRLIVHADRVLRALVPGATAASRASPAESVGETELGREERTLSIRLLRVDHAGEVCAQALYQGQALTARASSARDTLERAADEEADHLAWCEGRLRELGGRTSLLNPVLFGGSLVIGACAGLLGDRWNLGFLAETEHQVTRHLESHLQRIPATDDRSRAVLQQMKADEQEHATGALRHGGTALPVPVRGMMQLASRLMTNTTYWI